MVRKFLVIVCLVSVLAAGGVLLAQNTSTQQGTPDAAMGDASGALPGPVAAAEAAIVKQDWKSAETTLDAYLTSHPNDARALFDAGYVADAQNRLDDAASLYGRSIQNDSQRFEAHLSLGLLLARQGKTAAARPELAAATTFHGDDVDPALKARAWRALAEIDKPGPGGQGDAVQASNDLLEALKLSPESPADTLLAATLAEDSGQKDAAEAAYRRLLAKDSKSAEANAGLAHLLMTEQKYADAETPLRAALAETPGDPALTAELATDLAAQDKAEALPLLEQLHTAHPQDENITRMLAEVRAQSVDAAGADKMYLALLATRPNNVDLLMAHGESLIRQLRYAEAFTIFDKVTRLDDANGDAWSGLAFAASKTGRPEVTLHALTMRSKYLPELPSTYFLWATSFDTLHQKTQAIAYYRQFLEAAAGKFPDQEWQARQRLLLLEKK